MMRYRDAGFVSKMLETTFKDAKEAFDQAIVTGRLSANPKATNYAGAYMYMGTSDGKDLFKNIDSRRYDV